MGLGLACEWTAGAGVNQGSVSEVRILTFISPPWHTWPHPLIIVPSLHLAISSSCHLIILPSHHLAISSSCHLIILPSHHRAISSSCHLIIVLYTHLAISSSCHLIIVLYTHRAVSSSCHLIIVLHTHRAISSSCHLIVPVTAILMKRLRSQHPDRTIPDPTDFFMSRHGYDPLTFGAYSEYHPGWKDSYMDILRTPLAATGCPGGKPVTRIRFAGEGVCPNFNGYTHGAMISGQDVAARLIHEAGKGPAPMDRCDL
jgi:hypothetical protein